MWPRGWLCQEIPNLVGRSPSRGGPYENIEKIETFISEIFKMLGYDLTYKLPNFGGFELVRGN